MVLNDLMIKCIEILKDHAHTGIITTNALFMGF